MTLTSQMVLNLWKTGLNNLWEGGRAKDGPPKVDSSAQLRLAARGISSRSAILVGVLGHSVNLGIKTFLLIECGMAVLSPLLNAIINDGDHTHHHRRNSLPQRGKIRHR